MTTEHLIGIGFCQPKFYKPHIWRKAKAIMEWLCDFRSTEGDVYVIRYDFGRGKGKYMTTEDTPTNAQLAKIYDAAHA